MKPFLDEQACDILVLACTHFPLIKNEIASIFEQKHHRIALLDSGQGIARRVKSLLTQQVDDDLHVESNTNFAQAIFTSSIDRDLAFIEQLNDYGLDYAGRLND